MQNGTTAAQARSGKDIQGIPWDSITREKYRQTRLEQYRNNTFSIRHSGEGSQKVIFFSFLFFWGGGSFLYIKLLYDYVDNCKLTEDQ